LALLIILFTITLLTVCVQYVIRLLCHPFPLLQLTRLSVEEFGVVCQASLPATAGLRRRRDSLPHDSQVFAYLIKYCKK
jgi:hypothetical protein